MRRYRPGSGSPGVVGRRRRRARWPGRWARNRTPPRRSPPRSPGCRPGPNSSGSSPPVSACRRRRNRPWSPAPDGSAGRPRFAAPIVRKWEILHGRTGSPVGIGAPRQACRDPDGPIPASASVPARRRRARPGSLRGRESAGRDDPGTCLRAPMPGRFPCRRRFPACRRGPANGPGIRRRRCRTTAVRPGSSPFGPRWRRPRRCRLR